MHKTPLIKCTVTVVLVAKLSDSGRYSSGQLCTLGLFILAAGMLALAVISADASEIAIAIRLAICGLGFGLFQAPNMREIMSNAPAKRSGSASGIVVISRLMGQTLGAAMVAQCFHWWMNAAPVMSLWIGAASALLGAVFSGMRLKTGRVETVARS